MPGEITSGARANGGPSLKRQRFLNNKTAGLESKAESTIEQRRGRCPQVSTNRRDCLSKAIQRHIGEIVDSVFFVESSLPDDLIGNGCLTEDECRSIRERTDRKDQIRILLSIARGRDMNIMECLLKCLERDNADIVRMIRDCFEKFVSDRVRDKRCVRCKLKGSVNVKYVADALFSKECISERLYNEIIYTERHTGGQCDLWNSVLNELESGLNPQTGFKSFKDTLRAKGHYGHLADDIDRFTTADNKLCECACNVLLRKAPTRVLDNVESFEPKSSDGSNRDSDLSIELRSRVMEHRGSRPKAMLITSDLLHDGSSRDSDQSIELRSRVREHRGSRPNAMLITSDLLQTLMELKEDEIEDIVWI